MNFREEHDSMGTVRVPADACWGAQTQRSLENFPIGTEKMPQEIISAFALLKKACAKVNLIYQPQKMTEEKCQLICRICDDILQEKLADQFPLAVWQTGSGTQSNMNINEVIAHCGNVIAKKNLLHPNDDVNMSQSSNDTFPTAMHIAAATQIHQRLVPSLELLIDAFAKLEKENQGVIKSGRTHLQDATPIAFSQEISGWRGMLEHCRSQINETLPGLYTLAIGGTAVGTGLNAPKGFDDAVAKEIATLTGLPFVTDPNKFHALSSKDDLTFAHGALKTLAADLMKIANDIRWLASGPRLGLGEIFIPANEPGSSIMPGKVNPTQCEALTMVAVQVMANDVAVGFSSSQGNFQLNVYMPVCIYNFLQSVRLLADAMDSFRLRCVCGIRANQEKMHENLHRSLMLVTAISPIIGYENAARVAKKAYEEQLSLREACLQLGYMTAHEFDQAFHPEEMI
ncbi:MAG: class II fumarate hydratase [Clostridiales bacterium]|nr:class II fumarate hydratase [Clostridiales bacterium]